MIKTLNLWGNGQILAFSGADGATDYANCIVMRTAFETAGFDIRLPLSGGSIRFNPEELANNEPTLAGDFFICGNLKMVFIDTYHVLLEGDFSLSPGSSIEAIVSSNRILVGTKGFFNPELINSDMDEAIARRQAFINKLKFPKDISETTTRTLAKAISQMKTMVYAPEAEIKHYWTTPDRWPHRNMWLWDSVFHAIGLRHLDIPLAREAVLAVLGQQREDGFIPHNSCPGFSSDITQPPVLAFGVKQINEVDPSREFIAKSYPHLKGYLEWNMANRDTDGAGLLEWFIEENVDCRSGESGMDNSPRFDTATQLDATDFNAFMALECEIMAEFASQLGLVKDREIWLNHHARINKLINERLWDENAGFYFDYDVSLNRMSPVMASSGFLPLICGAATMEQAEKLAAHLENPDTFKTPLPVASIGICDKKSYSKDMWRGPVWVNINRMIAHGFRRYGLNAQADMILDKTIETIEKNYLKYGTFFEFYDDKNEVDPPLLLRKMRNLPDSYHQAFHDYGWTATLYVDMIYSHKNKIIKEVIEKSCSYC